MTLSQESIQFAETFADITENELYQGLKGIPRHGYTNTFDHSVRVAYLSHRLAQYLGEDAQSAARVGLLHDFCMVNYHVPREEKVDRGEWYCFYHPKDALENSRQYALNEREQAAILSHMFPLAKHVPKSRLACILTVADKVVAVYEGCYGMLKYYNRTRGLLGGVTHKVVRRS